MRYTWCRKRPPVGAECRGIIGGLAGGYEKAFKILGVLRLRGGVPSVYSVRFEGDPATTSWAWDSKYDKWKREVPDEGAG